MRSLKKKRKGFILKFHINSKGTKKNKKRTVHTADKKKMISKLKKI